jgi:hypothetical protein
MPGHMRGSTAGSEALRPTALAGDSFLDAPSGQIGAPWQPARSAGHQPVQHASAHVAGEGIEWLAVDDDRGDAWAAPARKRAPQRESAPQRERTAAADRVFSGRATTAHAPAGGGAPGPWGRRWAPPTARERRVAQPARWFAIAAPGRLEMDFRVEVPLVPLAPPRGPRALVPSCSHEPAHHAARPARPRRSALPPPPPTRRADAGARAGEQGQRRKLSSDRSVRPAWIGRAGPFLTSRPPTTHAAALRPQTRRPRSRPTPFPSRRPARRRPPPPPHAPPPPLTIPGQPRGAIHLGCGTSAIARGDHNGRCLDCGARGRLGRRVRRSPQVPLRAVSPCAVSPCAVSPCAVSLCAVSPCAASLL